MPPCYRIVLRHVAARVKVDACFHLLRNALVVWHLWRERSWPLGRR
jgi:hypothetical protein